MLTYFYLLGLILFDAGRFSHEDVAKSLMGNFTYLMGVVLLFYFGSKGVTEYFLGKAPPTTTEGSGATGPATAGSDATGPATHGAE